MTFPQQDSEHTECPLPSHHHSKGESHASVDIRARLSEGPTQSYLRDFVYGAIDGTVTTFAVVAGVAGAGLSPGIVLVLGTANLLADGFSMAASNFAGARAERDQENRIREEELLEIQMRPEGERAEIREIYRAKGFDGELLEQVVEVITADQDRWLSTMMLEEHGVSDGVGSPLKAAIATFVAFIVIGSLPLIPYVIDLAMPGEQHMFGLSAVFAALAFITVGVLKGHIVRLPKWRGAVETLAIGGAAAVVAYGVGHLLGGLA